MRRSTPALILLSLLALALAGCQGGDTRPAEGSTPPTTTAGTTAPDDERASLARAARSAIEGDHALSVRVLWTNQVPQRPRWTAGPALTELRRSAADREERGIRVRLVSERFRILDLTLDPSYTAATATVLSDQRVQPFGRNGQPMGKAVRLNERAQLELRRVGASDRFVVWKVVLLP